MAATKEKKKKRPLSMKKKIVLSVVAVVAVIAFIYLMWYLIKYRWYDGYKKYLTDYVYEQGTEFNAVSEGKPSVSGFELVTENDYLKLYINTKTTNVAIYDKRSGETTYTNPLEADSDPVANATNKNYLKSQLLVSYYNASMSQTTIDNYSKSIAKNQFKLESINNGVRIVYTVGDTEPLVNSDTKEESENTYFEIPLEYRLENDSVTVSVPTKGIVEHGDGYIFRIQLLRSMGAGSVDEDGYLVVPNGSGSLIRFNNGKGKNGNYSQYVYSIDPLVASYTTLEYTSGAMLPIFGICKENSTILAEIEGGSTIANITASVSGMYNSYNFAYAVFVIRNTDNLVMFGNAKNDTYIMEDNFYDINISVRYSFLSDKYQGYTGIANYYREKLLADGTLKKNTEKTELPFYYDVIAGVKEVGHILGVQYLHAFSMTTFDEAEQIADELATMGISNQVMNLQGWFNGGYYHDAPHDIRVLSTLGGKRGLSDLNDALKGIGGKLYADVAFQKVSFADKHYNYSLESSRYYGGGYVAAFGLIDPSSLRNTSGLGYSENRYNILSPKYLNRYVDKFTSKFQKMNVDGISLRDLGNTLSSDKFRTNITNREEALAIVKGQFETIEKTNKNVMVDTANLYSIGYADDIINVPYKGNDYFICDEEIPLYQMIIHGCVDYSSELLNDENEYHNDELILHLLETGSAPHFQITWNPASDMKDTALNRYYSTTFNTVKTNAAQVYFEVNDVLKNVTNAQIVNHEIKGDARVITYSNGVVIYVNYGDTEVKINGVTVPAKSYRTEGI